MATLPPTGSIEFELTDFDSAREALAVPPAGVEALQRIRSGGWEAQRRAQIASDRALSGATLSWVIGLPPDRRPHQLCDKHPRVANAVAAAWRDRAASSACLAGLLVATRPARRGFSLEVRRELERLAELRDRMD